jgi:hypothetical protein
MSIDAAVFAIRASTMSLVVMVAAGWKERVIDCWHTTSDSVDNKNEFSQKVAVWQEALVQLSWCLVSLGRIIDLYVDRPIESVK